jgi:hypothetical protein
LLSVNVAGGDLIGSRAEESSAITSSNTKVKPGVDRLNMEKTSNAQRSTSNAQSKSQKFCSPVLWLEFHFLFPRMLWRS